MAKRQNFVVGSTNAVTETMTTSELNHGFDRYEILTADKLDGTLKSVSDYSNDSSNEIANAIQSITGAQPTGASQSELANALQQMRDEIMTSSLTFIGYVSTTEPSSATYQLIEDNLWINSATMPTSFPVAASSIKRWNGTSWVNYGSTYTPKDFDAFRNLTDGQGYYWFGGQWVVMSTDMSTTYFTLNQSTGKWEIKSSVNLPGSPTTTTPAAGNSSTRIATTKFVADSFAPLASPALTGTPTAPTPDAADQSTKIATTQFVHDFGQRYVTNCITEIPQDIKLELNNGTLTLKAGSKVYVPNGAGVFDVVNITDDRSITETYNGEYLVAANLSTSITARLISNCVSGAGATTTSGFAYNTTTNIINNYSSTGTVGAQQSFPFAKITVSNGAITSIDQVFNGFGFIGSTVFALPGVKVLEPNGRNADGTLHNDSVTVQNVIAKTVPTNLGWHYLTINSAGTNGDLATNFYQAVTKPSNPTTYSRYYNPTENKVYNIVSGVYSSAVQAVIPVRIEHESSSPYKITSWDTPTVFHAVDYNDTDFIAHQAMPSKKSIDLTLGASGNSYTAPADGWFYLDKTVGTANTEIQMFNYSINFRTITATGGLSTGAWAYCSIYANKGDTVQIDYSVTGTTNGFRFIYANGAK